MRKTAACLLSFVVATAILASSPALASFGALIDVPTGPIYSPYRGPVTITFTFAPADDAAIFTVRLRQPGEGTIREKDYLVDPATDTSPHPVSFAWPDLTVDSPTDYEINVRRQEGGAVLTRETFTLLPPLVSDLSATPSPFYPLIQDGFRDETRIGFSLAAYTGATSVHVFADDDYGRCCGPEIRGHDLGPLAAGSHVWRWDGTRDDASAAPKGTYYARIEATDADDVSILSRSKGVELAKGTIRRTATRWKYGSAYSRVADKQATARGGNCFVSRNTETKEADILCANAAISMYWTWTLRPGERIESVRFAIDGGYYGCHRDTGFTKTESFIRVTSPPTSTCTVKTAKITYSYPVRV